MSGFTFENLIELPRPGSAIVNPSGTRALWPCSTFSFKAGDGKGRTEKSISLVNLDVKAGSATSPKPVLEHLSSLEAAWIDSHTFVFLRQPGLSTADGSADHPVDVSNTKQAERIKEAAAKASGVEVWAKDVVKGDEYKVGRLPTDVSDLKVVSTGHGNAILAFSALVYPDGDPYAVKEHDEKVEKVENGANVKVYDELFIRHWDTWKPTHGQLKQVQIVRLVQNPDSIDNNQRVEDGFEKLQGSSDSLRPDRWSFMLESQQGESLHDARPSIYSPLKGTKLECPVGAFGGADDFDLTSTHLVFHAKDPDVNPAWHTRTQVYLVPLSPRTKKEAVPRAITVGNQGACSNPKFSPDGKRITWLEMREDGYEADRNRVMLYDLASDARIGLTEKWDRSPSHVTWCPCSQRIYLQAEEEGHTKVFRLDVPSDSSKLDKSADPETLTQKQTVTSITPLDCERAVVTKNSFTSPNALFLMQVSKAPKDAAEDGRRPPRVDLVPLARATEDLAETKSLSRGEEFWFTGSDDHDVHGFILFPPGEQDASVRKSKGKRYPLAFLVHGGPQGAWTDSFSTRWNPNMYAARGYITVVINPTGSTGYGQKFCDDIKNNWGGRPFKDLVAGLDFVKTTYPEIDPDRVALLGASYGGFMANWWQGHGNTESTRVSCIVCHDGVFSTLNTFYTTEELYFPEREFGGTPWKSRETYERWNPERFVANWRTPQLLIHGGKDYRLTECESIAAFNTLQRRGVPSRLVYFPTENHWCLEPHNSLAWHQQVFEWIDKWTGTKA